MARPDRHPNDPARLFDDIAEQILSERDDVELNPRGSLVIRGGKPSVRAMTSRGAIVVRLDRQRVLELIEQGWGEHYKGQVNNWLVLTERLEPANVRRLVEEALSA